MFYLSIRFHLEHLEFQEVPWKKQINLIEFTFDLNESNLGNRWFNFIMNSRDCLQFTYNFIKNNMQNKFISEKENQIIYFQIHSCLALFIFILIICITCIPTSPCLPIGPIIPGSPRNPGSPLWNTSNKKA